MKVGLLLPEKKDTKKSESRLKVLFEHLDKSGIESRLIAYDEERIAEIEREISLLDAVLVWVNPIQNGKTREKLDAMLRRVSETDVFVSTHPDIILKIGTKDILYKTRNMSWGGDIYLYKNNKELREQFLTNLQKESRVLKQYRGNGGLGVWRVELFEDKEDPIVRVLHARRDSIEQKMLLSEFYESMRQYDLLIDQPYISPMPDGMTRAYMSQNRIIGFGHQYVTALMWPPNPEEPLHPKPRLYYPKDKEEFQKLREMLENKWIPELQQLLDIKTEQLPILWDTDFLIDSNSNYKLCEINVSSVYPYPEYGTEDIVKTLKSNLNG